MNRNYSTFELLSGLGIGLAAMWLLDPDAGKRRRASTRRNGSEAELAWFLRASSAFQRWANQPIVVDDCGLGP